MTAVKTSFSRGFHHVVPADRLVLLSFSFLRFPCFVFQLKDSRWQYTEIPLMMLNNPGGVSPDVYSKLRAPWNVNDRA